MRRFLKSHASVRATTVAVSVFAILLCSGGALAQERTGQNLNTRDSDETEPDGTGMSIRLGDCLGGVDDYRSETDMHDCIGIHARPCIQRPENDNTLGMEQCFIQELDGWRFLLQRYDRISDNALSRPGRLHDTQIAWEAYRDARCGYYSFHYDGGSMARWMGARCMMIETARRVIDLSPFAPDWAG